MLRLLSASDMRRCDQYTIEKLGVSSQTLMERAARAVEDVALQSDKLHVDRDTHIVVLCGSGNNGGDGFAAARFLREDGYDVTVCHGGAWAEGAPDTQRMSVECARQYALWKESGGCTEEALVPLDRKNTLVIDALFGIGLDRAPTGVVADWIDRVNLAKEQGAEVLSIDVPSGVHADTGELLGRAVRATVTVTVACPKMGLLLYPGASCVGDLKICDIGIGTQALVDEKKAYYLQKQDVACVACRPAYSNKGTFGRVLVLGGETGMSGAVYFAAKSAYRTGAGLVEIGSAEANRLVLQTLLPEAIFTPLEALSSDEELTAALDRADSVVLGCGLGQEPWAVRLVERVLRACQKPLLLDADALNLLSKNTRWRELLRARSTPVVITPHLGEAARLCQREIPDIATHMPAVADELAQTYHAVCVLKDARTVVSDGRETYIQTHGNSGMATGGAGDCLAGVIASLLAQYRYSNENSPTRLAALGVLLHALAGDAAAARIGRSALMASDLADAIGQVLAPFEKEM